MGFRFRGLEIGKGGFLESGCQSHGLGFEGFRACRASRLFKFEL